MNLAPIVGVKTRLKAMYAGYRFEMKAVHSTHSYSITVFKSTNNISTITIPADTPMTEFWERIHAWMRPIIRYSGN